MDFLRSKPSNENLGQNDTLLNFLLGQFSEFQSTKSSARRMGLVAAHLRYLGFLLFNFLLRKRMRETLYTKLTM
jgi:hypothetical protein